MVAKSSEFCNEMFVVFLITPKLDFFHYLSFKITKAIHVLVYPLISEAKGIVLSQYCIAEVHSIEFKSFIQMLSWIQSMPSIFSFLNKKKVLLYYLKEML